MWWIKWLDAGDRAECTLCSGQGDTRTELDVDLFIAQHAVCGDAA
jgi:hypothetical protein